VPLLSGEQVRNANVGSLVTCCQLAPGCQVATGRRLADCQGLLWRKKPAAKLMIALGRSRPQIPKLDSPVPISCCHDVSCFSVRAKAAKAEAWREGNDRLDKSSLVALNKATRRAGVQG